MISARAMPAPHACHTPAPWRGARPARGSRWSPAGHPTWTRWCGGRRTPRRSRRPRPATRAASPARWSRVDHTPSDGAEREVAGVEGEGHGQRFLVVGVADLDAAPLDQADVDPVDEDPMRLDTGDGLGVAAALAERFDDLDLGAHGWLRCRHSDDHTPESGTTRRRELAVRGTTPARRDGQSRR